MIWKKMMEDGTSCLLSNGNPSTVAVPVGVHVVSRVIVLAQEKVEKRVLSIFEHVAWMAAISGASIFARHDTMIRHRWQARHAFSSPR